MYFEIGEIPSGKIFTNTSKTNNEPIEKKLPAKAIPLCFNKIKHTIKNNNVASFEVNDTTKLSFQITTSEIIKPINNMDPKTQMVIKNRVFSLLK